MSPGVPNTQSTPQGQGCVQCQGSELGLEPEELKAVFVEKWLQPKKPGVEGAAKRGRVQAHNSAWLGCVGLERPGGPCSAAV